MGMLSMRSVRRRRYPLFGMGALAITHGVLRCQYPIWLGAAAIQSRWVARVVRHRNMRVQAWAHQYQQQADQLDDSAHPRFATDHSDQAFASASRPRSSGSSPMARIASITCAAIRASNSVSAPESPSACRSGHRVKTDSCRCPRQDDRSGLALAHQQWSFHPCMRARCGCE